jgi:hypothetical protein
MNAPTILNGHTSRNSVDLNQVSVESGFRTTHNMPGIRDRLRVAVIRRAEACIQAGGGHMNIYCKVIDWP